MKSLSEAKVAIVFEWLHQFGGSEQVVAGMKEAFPDANLFGLIHDPESLKGTSLQDVPVETSFIQRLPKAKEKYRSYLPLMPLAVEQHDLRDYDIVLSSSHAVNKGILTSADQLHISYTHTPIRYAWDLYQEYLNESGLTRGIKGWLARVVLHYIRIWDTTAANRVDAYLANSAYVARRIEKLYRRRARVVHPPVSVGGHDANSERNGSFVAMSRFVPYKRMELIVRAFTKMGKPLVVIGDGPDWEKVEREAGLNVQMLGYQPDEVIADHFRKARGFIFAADEDFGMVPVEAQAAGCPVIAYGKGGALETVVGWPSAGATGVFYDAQTPESLEEAVELFETHEREFDPVDCRRNAERFSHERFGAELESTVEEVWEMFQRGERLG